MCSLKSQGGLTRGSGISKHQRTVRAMSSAVSSAYNFAMQELTARSYTTSEQHKELSASRMRRDETDLGKVGEKLDSFTPFSADESLHNIITGIDTNENVNVLDLFKIRKDIAQKMDGQSSSLALIPMIILRNDSSAENGVKLSSFSATFPRSVSSLLNREADNSLCCSLVV